MPTWYDTTALDALLNEIKNNAVTVRLLDDYSQADNFSTVNTNTIAQTAINPSSFTGPVANGSHRRMTFDGASATATSNSTVGDLHIALCSADTVYAVTDETSDQPITSGNSVNIPAFYLQSSQPTQV